MAAGELTPHEEHSLLRLADGPDAEHEVEEADVSRLQSLALIEQRGFSFGLTMMGVRKVAQLQRSYVPRYIDNCQIGRTVCSVRISIE